MKKTASFLPSEKTHDGRYIISGAAYYNLIRLQKYGLVPQEVIDQYTPDIMYHISVNDMAAITKTTVRNATYHAQMMYEKGMAIKKAGQGGKLQWFFSKAAVTILANRNLPDKRLTKQAKRNILDRVMGGGGS